MFIGGILFLVKFIAKHCTIIDACLVRSTCSPKTYLSLPNFFMYNNRKTLVVPLLFHGKTFTTVLEKAELFRFFTEGFKWV